MTEKLYVSFFWHQHQPYYKNDLTGRYILPWVRLHSVKDYYDMVAILENYQNVKMTFNLVPSLLLQIKDYVENGARDDFWIISAKNVNELTSDDKFFLVKNFFLCNWARMVEPHPRYKQLLEIRGKNSNDDFLKNLIGKLDNQYFLDLQVWFNLCWVDPYFKTRDNFIKYLFEKGENFNESEKLKLLEKHIEIMGKIIPKHKELFDKKQIDLSTSPFYHPILPLLIDSSISKISSPIKPTPKNKFTHKEDARAQIENGLKYFEEIFEKKPSGMWPSEGSVSNEVLDLMQEFGIKWLATDEDILFNSLNLSRNRNDLYNAYKYKNLSLVFRDKRLSDLIGFTYSNMNARIAVNDFMDNLRNIKNNLPRGENNIVNIILDGENCWEYFENDGNEFLNELYSALNNSDEFETITISEYLDKFGTKNNLDNIWPGSWINSNFDIWIGHPEDNDAWDWLYKTRNFLEKKMTSESIENNTLMRAWNEIHIAEGSDWFWWYGDDHSSSNDSEYDSMFRQHLQNVYKLLGEEYPAKLDDSIRDHIVKSSNFQYTPIYFITPTIDGKNTNFFEWYNAGFYSTEKSGAAMHKVTNIVKNFYYGYDLENFYMKIEPRLNFTKTNKNIEFLIDFDNNLKARVYKSKNEYLVALKNLDESIIELPKDCIGADDCIEIKIPFTYFGTKPQNLSFTLKALKFDLEMEIWPSDDKIQLNIIENKFFW